MTNAQSEVTVQTNPCQATLRVVTNRVPMNFNIVEMA